MTIVAGLISQFGAPVVVTAAVIFMVLRSDIRFVYPRKKPKIDLD